MVKSRFARGAAEILLLRDLCELETRLGFSHLTTGLAQTLAIEMVEFCTLQGLA